MLWGGRYLKAWSKTMEVLALSSGESELGGLVKACAEGLGVQAGMKDFGFHLDLKVLFDATAATGMARRLGLGRPQQTYGSSRKSEMDLLVWPSIQEP